MVQKKTAPVVKAKVLPPQKGEEISKKEDSLEEILPKALIPISPQERLPAVTDPLHRYLSEIGKLPLLTREEEEALARHYTKHQDKESAQKLVVSNLRLVVKIAMEYSRAFHNILDLIQEGNMGLMRAVSKYDLEKGTRFSYYAAWWIRAYILKFIIDNFRLVKIGTTQAQKKLFYNLMKEKRKIEAMGFAPKAKLLSEKLDVKEREIVEMEQRMGSSDMSLDAPSPHLDGKLNMDMFSGSEASPEVQAEQDELKKKLFENLEEFVGNLKEKEKKIFQSRLYSEVPATLQEIADSYGITRERVRQIEERVVSKLKSFFKEKGFEVDLEQGKK
jgi:RNA polymerase sigma-32 factor